MRKGSRRIEADRAMGDGVGLESTEEVYLSAAVARVGATDAERIRRAKGTQASLRSLIHAKILVHGMDVGKEAKMRSVFLE